VVSRRRFLLGAGAGAAGLAVGAASTAAALEGAAADKSALKGMTPGRMAQRAEDVGAAGPYGRPQRLGVQQVVWSARPTGQYAAISFDDGPTPEFTPRILEALADVGVRATFFAMGYNASRSPDLIRAILAGGHEIGNHTWSHLDQTTIDAPQIREEILRCKSEIEGITQRPLIGFRPPRGELTGYAGMVCAELGYDVYMWSIERGPAGTSTPAAVTQHLVENLQAGDIIDLHDGLGRGTFSPGTAGTKALAARREVEVQALPVVLDRIAARGITLTTVTDLMRRSAVAAAVTEASA
jgi:peptidoglycan/xylan/chitin deacetylase (PgdA/CDA1 family)